MKYSKFTIKNFKGIQDAELDLVKYPNGNIFPFVGLNEAGKTTILEAINFFHNESFIEEKRKIIHKKDQSIFTGHCEVTAILILDAEDKKIIQEDLEKRYSLKEIPNKLTITRKWYFENGRFVKKEEDLINFDIFIKIKSEIENEPEKEDLLLSHEKSEWQKIINNLTLKIPKIIYYPSFLSKFPEKIYLEDITNTSINEKEKETNNFYKLIIDDILKSANADYSLIDFVKKIKDISNPDNTQAADSLIQDISNILNKKVISHWKKIFDKKNSNLSITISKGFNLNTHYLNIKILKGGRTYEIDDGSLGFRWFFTFILFTEFRKKREGENGEYLFLFDEPASNLHEGAQAKLLDLLKEISLGAKILYTTHSPYLIDDKNIINCFVVKDEGFKLEEDLLYSQDIKCYPYRQFVSSDNLEDKSYTMHFKPLLDALDFKEHMFNPKTNIILTEGKFDYYTFKWMKEISVNIDDFNFYPGSGVSAYDQLLRDYLANNKKFIAIFDADGNLTKENSKGKYWKGKYIEGFNSRNGR